MVHQGLGRGNQYSLDAKSASLRRNYATGMQQAIFSYGELVETLGEPVRVQDAALPAADRRIIVQRRKDRIVTAAELWFSCGCHLEKRLAGSYALKHRCKKHRAGFA